MPRCECVSDSDCKRSKGRGYYCEDCECSRIPGFEGDLSCDLDDLDNEECSERKSFYSF